MPEPIPTSAHVCTAMLGIDLSAFTEPRPPEPKGADPEYWAMFARMEMAYLRAMKLLTGQAYRDMEASKHLTLCHALTASECLLGDSARSFIAKHIEAGGTEGEALLAELATSRAQQ